MSRLKLLVPVVLLLGCEPSVPETWPDPAGAVIPSALQVYPPTAGLGTTVTFDVGTVDAPFSGPGVQVDFGPGLQVQDVVVVDPTLARVTVRVDPDADLGPRHVSVVSGSWSQVASDAVQIVAGSLQISPDRGPRGQVVQVDLVGTHTDWRAEAWADFGAGTQVLDMVVHDASHATASVAIHPDAQVGLRDVRVDDVLLYGGFAVEPQVVTATFESDPALQGEPLDFVIAGVGTDWQPGTSVEFWSSSGPSTDLQVHQLQVPSPVQLSGGAIVSNAAPPGLRDVVVRGTDRTLFIPDAVEVVEVAPPIDNAVLLAGWTVDRAIDSRGREQVEAGLGVVFAVPLDPPCGPPPPPQWGVPRYDLPTVVITGDRRARNCPVPKTLDAGPSVWLRSEQGAIELRREWVEEDGYYRYRAPDAVARDYRFDQTFALVTSGEGQVPAVDVPGVLRTVPADIEILEPEPFTLHDRIDDLTVRWTPGQTHPLAFLTLSLRGTLFHPPVEASVQVIPWDDGETTLPFELLTQLEPGEGSLVLESEIEGLEYELPFSESTQRVNRSSIRVEQVLELE